MINFVGAERGRKDRHHDYHWVDPITVHIHTARERASLELLIKLVRSASLVHIRCCLGVNFA